MLTELSSEKFEWFGPSPIEPKLSIDRAYRTKVQRARAEPERGFAGRAAAAGQGPARGVAARHFHRPLRQGAELSWI